jgi:hypothetical protein
MSTKEEIHQSEFAYGIGRDPSNPLVPSHRHVLVSMWGKKKMIVDKNAKTKSKKKKKWRL